MRTKYGDDVEFFMIYTREAHAADSDRPSGKNVEQPVSTEERRQVAANFLDEMKLEMPALLDSIDDQASTGYASLPDRMYLVGKSGKIAYAGDRGPRGFKPDELERAIQKELGVEVDREPSTTPEPRTGSFPQMDDRRIRMMSMRMPAFAAMNTDGDGQLSAEEMEAAPSALLTLDKDGDGELSAEELAPAGGFGGRGGGRGGRGRGQ